nr:odorant receptor 77 [Graphosoma rubrolineatum]
MMGWPFNRKEISEIWKWPHIFWLNIFGWWAEQARTEFLRRWLSRYRFVLCVYFTIVTSMMLIAVGVKCVQGGILDNMFTVFGCCPGIVGIFKVYCLILFSKPLKTAMEGIDELFIDSKDPNETRMIRRTLKRVWIIFTFYLIMGSCISLHWVVRPVISAILFGEKTRIVDTWPPFIDTWPQFFFSFCYQLPMILGLGHAFYIFDNIYFCISECILCNLDVLKYRLSRMKLKTEQERSKDLVHSIEYYSKILRTCTYLRDSSSAVIIFQCIITVTILCSGVFIITMAEHTEVNVLMNLGEESTVVIFVLYFYCWYSNEIRFQCQDVCNAAYMSDWINGTEENKKKLADSDDQDCKTCYVWWNP